MSIYLTGTSLENDSTVLIIWAVFVGVCLGFIFNFVSKAVVGPFVRALLSSDAIGEDKAVSLSELGFSSKKLLRLALKDGSSLMNTVSVAGGEFPLFSNGKKKSTDYEKARFYISADKKDKAQITYGSGEKWYMLIIFIALAFAVAFLMTKVMPLLVEALF